MIRHIARKELIEMLRDGRFRMAAAIVGLLLLVSLGAGWTHYRQARAQHEAATDVTRQHWLDQGEKNPHSAAHYGIYAFKPRLPLSFVDQGVDPYVGTSVWLEAHRQNEFLMRPAQDASAAQRFGNLTTAGVLQQLVPLLVVMLAFGAFAGEREQGTLRQLLSQGVSRRELLAGKSLGIAGAMALLLAPVAVVGSVAILLGSPGTAPATLGRAALLSLVYLVYFAIFAAVALAVSARAGSQRVALVGLLGFWMLNGLVAPRVAVGLSKSLYPAPSAFEFTQRMQDDLESGTPEAPALDERALEREVLDRYGAASIEELPVNYDGILMQASEVHGNVVFDAHYGALWDTFERQSRVHELAALVAPLLAVRSLSMSLAGTDVEQHRHFAAAAEQYRRDLVKAMNEDQTVNSRTGEWDYLADRALWQSIETFEYEAPALATVVEARRLSLVFLALWLILGTLGAVRAAVRARIE